MILFILLFIYNNYPLRVSTFPSDFSDISFALNGTSKWSNAKKKKKKKKKKKI